MASKYLNKYETPTGFSEIMHDYAREVIRFGPLDIIEFSAIYFKSLQEGPDILHTYITQNGKVKSNFPDSISMKVDNETNVKVHKKKLAEEYERSSRSQSADVSRISIVTSKEMTSSANSGVVEIRLDADKNEKMFNIMVEEGKEIGFMVSGKWRINELEYVDSKGYSSSATYNGFSIGACLGRILGDEEVFAVTDFCEYIPKVSGPLILWMNIDPSVIKIKPEGYLDLVIKNITTPNYNSIENSLRWDKNALLEDLIDDKLSNLLSENEREQLYNINKFRSNPALYAKTYIKHMESSTETVKQLYKELINMKPMPLLKPNRILKESADILCEYLSSTGKFTNEDEEGCRIEARIKSLSDTSTDKLYENIFVFSDGQPLNLIINLLIDDVPGHPNRINLMNENINYIGLTVCPHDKYKWVCVQEFSEEEIV